MRERTVAIRKAFCWSANAKKNYTLTDLFLTPKFCPLNRKGLNFAPNPNCYEIGIEGYTVSLCCWFDGAKEKDDQLVTKCICPRGEEKHMYERHNYKMVQEEN